MGQFQQTCVSPSLPEAKPSQDGREPPGPCGPARRLRRRPRERELDQVPARVSRPTMTTTSNSTSTLFLLSKLLLSGLMPLNQVKYMLEKKCSYKDRSVPLPQSITGTLKWSN